MRLSDEYEARIGMATHLVTTRLRNSLVNGYHNAVEGVIGLVAFLLQYGPSLLFWSVLYYPARLAWRRWRAA